MLDAVLVRGVPLDEAVGRALASAEGGRLEPRDRGFARLLAASVLRHKGELDAVIAAFLLKPLPIEARRLQLILQVAAAQLLLIDTKPHAAISIAVDQCRRDPLTRRFDRLANAVLRRISVEGPGILGHLDRVRADIPDWLWERWTKHYGPDTARRIAAGSLREAPLDLTVREDAAAWAARLRGALLSTGSVRLEQAGRVEDIEGYGDGAWWVQDAAAALPARLLGDVAGREVVDLCAAPGGKTAELAAAGAHVTAVDISEARLRRVRENLARLRLKADLVVADAASWVPGRTFDAVLLDAPCSATGTIRRHPDILHLKREADVARLAGEQRRLIDRALELVTPGGVLVYATCSLEPEEGEHQVAALLERQPVAERMALTTQESANLGLSADWVTPAGDLRTLPFHTPPGGVEGGGMDGFYAARIRRRG